jgi:hypothetical protein
VIGSISPDIFMMLPIPAVVHFAHTPLGLVTADLAVGRLIGDVDLDPERSAGFILIALPGRSSA